MWNFCLLIDLDRAFLFSYVDDGTIVVQSPTIDENTHKLPEAYQVIFECTEDAGLVLEHDKTELFHFAKTEGVPNPPIDLGYAPHTGDTPLFAKKYWRYLDFYLDRQLSFKEHLSVYTTKALTSVNALGMLDNSARWLDSWNKHLLYHSCVLPMATYRLISWTLN